MENVINSQYEYLKIPQSYVCVYNQLLLRLSEYGTQLLKDCTTDCKTSNKQLITCWNMFQSACAAYELGEDKKASLFINYIIKQLQLKCSDKGILHNITIDDFNVDYEIIDTEGLYIYYIDFTIDNIENVRPNTLMVEYYDRDINTYIPIINNSPVVSPTNTNDFLLDINGDKEYKIRMSVKNIDGVRIYSKEFDIKFTNEEYKNRNTVIYSNIDILPQTLINSPNIVFIVDKDNYNKQYIGSEKVTKISTVQDKKINYVFVPTGELILSKILYGDVPTVLWDINNPDAASITKIDDVINPIDNTKGTLYFNYIPNSQFEEKIIYIFKLK